MLSYYSSLLIHILIKNTYFIFILVFGCMLYVLRSPWHPEDGTETLELDLQVIASHLARVLGTEVQSFESSKHS